MKKKALQFGIGLFIITNCAFAQQWDGSINTLGDLYRSGSLGLGTAFPAAKLDINFFNQNSATPQHGLLLQTNTFYTADNANNSYYLKTLDQGNGAVAFIVTGNNRVGINNSNPTFPLDVNGDVHTTGVMGIGTTNVGSFKLAVEGKIAARGVKVSLASFADYVFDSTYQLRPLTKLEQYINQNKHLPGIPSAEEVKKEGGIELGDMNVKLLEKIEELTLYVIDLKKENEQMKKEMKNLMERK